MTPWDDKDFWFRWREHQASRGIRDYCFDGAGPEYWQTIPRVLFTLKEPNAHRGTDMRDQLAKGPEKQIWHAFGRWAAGILDGFPPYSSLTRASLRSAMRRVAAINLKKATGRATTWSTELHVACHADRVLLTEQIRNLDPELIVACGTFDPLLWVLDLPVSVSELTRPLLEVADHPTVLRWRHPARASEADYRKLAAHLSQWARRAI